GDDSAPGSRGVAQRRGGGGHRLRPDSKTGALTGSRLVVTAGALRFGISFGTTIRSAGDGGPYLVRNLLRDDIGRAGRPRPTAFSFRNNPAVHPLLLLAGAPAVTSTDAVSRSFRPTPRRMRFGISFGTTIRSAGDGGPYLIETSFGTTSVGLAVPGRPPFFILPPAVLPRSSRARRAVRWSHSNDGCAQSSRPGWYSAAPRWRRARGFTSARNAST
ncbi:MAG: hypothetical protein RLZZ188_3310, partial [Verrucomicrobiota bacterium]